MKILFRIKYIIVFTLFVNTNCQSKEQSKDSITDKVKVELYSIEEFQNERKVQLPLREVENTPLFWKDKMFNFSFLFINDSSDDPGDFHEIKVKYINKEYSFSNIGGWVTFSRHELQFFNDIEDNLLKDSNFGIVLPANETDLFLIAFGYHYSSDPAGLLSIIYIPFVGEPYLIYNDNTYLFAYEFVNGTGQITVSLYNSEELKQLPSSKGLITYRNNDGKLQILE